MNAPNDLSRPTVGVALTRLLLAAGVEQVFGIPGNHNLELYRGLDELPIEHVTARHEQGAAFMADGYARASGRFGVCILISGPGLLNAATPMAQALADSVPMLVITAVRDRAELGSRRGRLHELPDQQAAASTFSRWSKTLTDPNELPELVSAALATFNTERPGPVHIEIPLDLMTAAVTVPLELVSARQPSPNPDRVAEATNLLNGSDRPLIIAGGGAAGAVSALRALAERLDAPVANTVNGKGVLPPSHPLTLGGSPSQDAIRQAIASSDVVLAVGTEFGETDYDLLFGGEFASPATLVRVDIDKSQLSLNLIPDIGLHGDASGVLEALLKHVVARERGGKAWASDVRSNFRDEPHWHPEIEAVFDVIQSALPNALVVGDSTLPTYYAAWMWASESPRRYFHSASGFGTLGYALPAAIGSALAVGGPKLPVLALIGDGGLQFTLPELAVARQLELPLIVLVWNNAGYSEIENSLTARGISASSARITGPSLRGLAGAYDLAYAEPGSIAELSRDLNAARGAAAPTLVNLRQERFVSTPAGQWYA